MTRPRRFLLRMVLFLAAIAGVVGVLLDPVQRAFLSNPALNGLIVAAFLFGVLYVLRQVLMLGADVTWIEAYQRARHTSTANVPDPPDLLAPMATLLETRGRGGQPLSPLSLRSMLDSIAARLDEVREISRYLIALLIFLGLLGTFWGLLETVTAVGKTISGLSLGSSAEPTQLFDKLREGLASPLVGMGTAFSASLFGLSGSLVLGFLDLQAGQAQNRFYNELEEWLSGMTRLGAAGPVGEAGEQSVPAYVQALLEQTAEGLDNLQRAMSRAEENRGSANATLLQLAERLSSLTDQMRAEQALMMKLAEGQMELRPVLARLAQPGDAGGLDAASRNHLRNIDVYVTRLFEDSAEGRNRLVEEIRGEFKLLARTLAAISDERRKVT
jgi:hypothetical protein